MPNGHARSAGQDIPIVADTDLDAPGQHVRTTFGAGGHAGKTVHGTIPTDESNGLHLLAAYLPQEGVVLAQIAVETRSNEIGAPLCSWSRRI